MLTPSQKPGTSMRGRASALRSRSTDASQARPQGTTPVTLTAVTRGLGHALRARGTARPVWAIDRTIGARCAMGARGSWRAPSRRSARLGSEAAVTLRHDRWLALAREIRRSVLWSRATGLAGYANRMAYYAPEGRWWIEDGSPNAAAGAGGRDGHPAAFACWPPFPGWVTLPVTTVSSRIVCSLFRAAAPGRGWCAASRAW